MHPDIYLRASTKFREQSRRSGREEHGAKTPHEATTSRHKAAAGRRSRRWPPCSQGQLSVGPGGKTLTSPAGSVTPGRRALRPGRNRGSLFVTRSDCEHAAWKVEWQKTNQEKMCKNVLAIRGKRRKTLIRKERPIGTRGGATGPRANGHD